MPQRDLLDLADLAVRDHVSPDLPGEVIRILTQATGASSGALVKGDRSPAASWPNGAVVEARPPDGEWKTVPLGREESGWTALLKAPRLGDETLFVAARLALRVWDLREELRRSRFDQRFRLWELEAVRSIAQGIGGVLDPRKIAQEVIAHVVSLMGVRNAEIVLGGDGRDEEVLGRFGDPVVPRPIQAAVWEDGLRNAEMVAAPLPGTGGSLGLLAVAHKEARTGAATFDKNDFRLVDLFAVQTAVALENARLSRASIERARLRQEMELAATIQSHLYPGKAAEIPGLRVKTSFRPARQVGGDLFEIIPRADGLLAVVADVTGKGVGAGLIAAGLHAGIRLLADEALPIEVVAERLNTYLAGATEDNRFATMVMVEVRADGSFTAVHAGHCPGLLRRAEGSVITVESTGLPLGIVPDARYTAVHGRLKPGDLVVLYTDGLTEAENAAGDELGVERLEELVRAMDPEDVDTLCEQILDGVRRFAGDVPLADDATLVVLKKEGPPTGVAD